MKIEDIKKAEGLASYLQNEINWMIKELEHIIDYPGNDDDLILQPPISPAIFYHCNRKDLANFMLPRIKEKREQIIRQLEELGVEL